MFMDKGVFITWNDQKSLKIYYIIENYNSSKRFSIWISLTPSRYQANLTVMLIR